MVSGSLLSEALSGCLDRPPCTPLSLPLTGRELLAVSIDCRFLAVILFLSVSQRHYPRRIPSAYLERFLRNFHTTKMTTTIATTPKREGKTPISILLASGDLDGEDDDVVVVVDDDGTPVEREG